MLEGGQGGRLRGDRQRVRRTSILTDEELERRRPEEDASTIEIEAFVELEEIDPIYFDHPYFLVPAGETDGTVRAYRLLAEVMGRPTAPRSGASSCARKEYLVAIRARERALTLDDDALPRRGPPDRRHPRRRRAHQAKAEVERAVKLIEAMTVEWDPADYEDDYRKRLQAIVAQEAQGRRDQGARRPTARPPSPCRT